MTGQVQAILWAQLRSLLHALRGSGKLGTILAGLVLLAWYGVWMSLGALLFRFAMEPASRAVLTAYLPRGMFFLFLYWQLGPVLLGSQGATLDLRKLLAFPIPQRQLFNMEILLRVTTGIEVLLVMVALTAGLALNPAVAVKTAPVGVGFFVLFNLLVGAGLKHQLEGWLARRRLRELLVLVAVLAAALPQLLLRVAIPAPLRAAVGAFWLAGWPWSVASSLALGDTAPRTWAVALLWLGAAWVYGRRQFERGLRLETVIGGGGASSHARARRSLAAVYRLPSRFLPDPLAAMVEKEVRSLARSPRFRLLFIMGFTFGVVIFLPLLLRSKSAGTSVPSYQLAMISAYALLLLGDVLFWNIFGHDRAAAQLYFLQPPPFALVVVAKNLAAGLFVVLEIAGIITVWALLRLPLDVARITEAYLAPAVVCLYMMAAGNIISVYYPRPVSPEKATAAGAAVIVRILLLLLVPILSIPVLLAYGARYAFASEPVFYGVLGFAALLGMALYRLALVISSAMAGHRKEQMAQVLSAGEGPIRMA